MVLLICLLALCSLADFKKTHETCPPEWEYFDGHCYAIGKVTLSWTQATSVCKSSSAKLGEIMSAEENTFVQKLARNMNVECIWLGGTDMFKEGTWIWASKRKRIHSFKNWYPGEPKNYGGDENCLNLQASYGKMWNDAPCKKRCHFVCEQETYY